MIATRIVGRELRVTGDFAAPNRPAPQPHWNTATVTPSAAAIDSRNPRMEVIGTRIVRNANVSRMNASPTTTSRKIGSASVSLVDTSMLDAVVPPTSRSMLDEPESWVRSPLIWFTRAVVALSLGPVVGMTWMTAVSFWNATGLAEITPGTFDTLDVILATSPALVTGLATTSSGPL